MNVFCRSYDCRSRVHCPTCRSDPDWRRRVGAPQECPYGVTAATQPRSHAATQGTQSAIGQRRQALCVGCDHGRGGICTLEFPQVKGCKDVKRYRTGWVLWLVEPSNKCPKKLW